MKTRCEQIDQFLLEGDPRSMELAAAHAEGCSDCLQKLAEWSEISQTAKGLQRSWRSDLLWPRIERALRAEKRSIRQGQFLKIAAVVVVTVGLAAASWYAGAFRARQSFEKEILQMAAVDEVERAEKAHLEAIDKLEKLAEPRLKGSETPLMVSFKEKLMLLDDAIAECEASIAENRQNAHLRRQLLAIYSEKQRTLRDVIREANNATTE
jgi:hypothetical protein